MSFDGSGQSFGAAAQGYIRDGRDAGGQAEKAFYSGGLVHASGRALVFSSVPAADILKDLPVVPITLTRRSIAEAAEMRNEYQRMLRTSGLRTYLQRQFFKKVQKECCWRQQYARRPLHEPSPDRVQQEFLTYELHHLVPISLGGSNDLNNLAFIPHDLHTKIHHAINRATNHLREGKTETIAIPYPQGIFPVRPKVHTAQRKQHDEVVTV
jgi:hypothetical protein